MKTGPPEIICCGHAAWDLNFLMDEFPIEDQKYKIDNLVQTGGGPASNAASLLAAWGVPVAYAGLLGDDIYGRLILEELSASGVDTRLVRTDVTKNTPLSAVIVNTANGSRTLLNRRDAADQPAVTPEAISVLKEINPAVLHFDGHALELSLKMIEMFPEAQIVMDAGSFTDATDRLCSAADYAVCSRRFAEVCTGIDDITGEEKQRRCLEKLCRRYGGTVVVTLGSEGLFYGCKNPADDGNNADYKSLGAFRVEAVDSTGAGDIFHAAFSYGLLKRFPLEKILRLASASAAISVTRAGARTSIPGLEESMELAGI